MSGFWVGLLAVIAGGAMQGSFAVPQKYVRGWPWEKNWLFYSIAGMIVFPWLLVALVVPHAAQVYSNVDGGVLAKTALFGVGWGLGSVLFGLGMARVGIALAFAIVISLTAAVGSLVPMAVLYPDDFASWRGGLLVLGLVVVIAGVVFCARAGALKESGASASRRQFARGLLICIASGITSPMLNFGFAFGNDIGKQAVRLGASPVNAPIAIFALAISAGFLVNAGYCIYLLARNGTWGQGLAADRLSNLAYSFGMGFLWLVGFYLYGLGAAALGRLGSMVGWPIFMTLMVVIANLWGLATGEWKNTPRLAFQRLWIGIALMVAALAIIAPANR